VRFAFRNSPRNARSACQRTQAAQLAVVDNPVVAIACELRRRARGFAAAAICAESHRLFLLLNRSGKISARSLTVVVPQ